MKTVVSLMGLVVFLFGNLSVLAQKHENFAQRPSKRREAVQRARARAAREKEDARQWAAARGLKMRRDDGRRVVELMAVRNGRPIYYTTVNDDAAISTAADQVRNAAPFSVNGSGMTVGVWDAGSVLTSHQEFGSRVSNMDGAGSHYHATHVGGTIGASGVVASAEGMVPNADVDSYDWNFDNSEMTSRAASYSGESGKIYLSNHSYSHMSGWSYTSESGSTGWHWSEYLEWSADAEEDNFGRYSYTAQQWDNIVYDAPYYLPFKAAANDRSDGPANGETVYYYDDGWKSILYTNAVHPKGDGIYKDGYDTISTFGCAKNVITIGAIEDAVNGASRSLIYPYAQMTSFSGWGPADDGRIKPDIVANGIALYSCTNGFNSAYAYMSGTSMSSPNACGSAALLVDYYDDRLPGQAMRASTLKGLIIHTADDLGRPGPDYIFGWGLMNTLAAAELIGEYADGNPLRMTEALLHSTTNTWDTYSFFCDGIEPIRATLCWTDPAGSWTSDHDNRTARLVNDLDLKISGPGGTYYPYKLSYANPTNNATADSENNVDNVEQVYISAPTVGQYTITVDYDGSLTGGEQYYSLLVSGNANDLDDDGMSDTWEGGYFGSPTGAVAGVDSDGDGTDNLTEYVAGTNPTNLASVFGVENFEAPATGNSPFIISWDPSVEGRIYSVEWNTDLIHGTFSNISGNLPFPINSYTDTVERVEPHNFYRVNVRLQD